MQVEEIQEFIRKRIKIVEDDLKGTDEDVSLCGETKEYGEPSNWWTV
jgi:hypothetical protein